MSGFSLSKRIDMDSLNVCTHYSWQSTKNFLFLESLAHREWGATHSRIKSPRQKLLLRDATTTKNVLVLVARPENVKPLSKWTFESGLTFSQAILVTLLVKNATVGNIWCFKVNKMFPIICCNIQVLKNFVKKSRSFLATKFFFLGLLAEVTG